MERRTRTGVERESAEEDVMSQAPDSRDQMLSKIEAGGPPLHRQRRRWILATAAVTVLAAVGLFLFGRSDGAAGVEQWEAEAVTSGTLTVKVSATGNLQPTNEVDVGSEVSGLVEKVFVDDNDRVKTGQMLAQLDISKLEDQRVNASAALASAEARVQQAAASVKEAQANLSRLREVSKLSGGKVPSKAEMETAEATAERAEADQASARAAVEQARASLNSAQINIAKASIRSPINGVVLSRQIEPGQTVAASFQAPTLFTLAEDLAAMELEVDVDEADVGQVREGQPATFTVDAYPGRQYPAHIRRVGYGSQTKDGVVTYTAVLSVDNADLTLRPGMTATASITTIERTNVLLVPNAALRFSPATAESPQDERNGGIVGNLLPRPPGMGAKNGSSNGTVKPGAGRVWVLQSGKPSEVVVTVGHTDGRVTEVSGAGLKAGQRVITDAKGAQP
jgi:HlyD family secretion protein